MRTSRYTTCGDQTPLTPTEHALVEILAHTDAVVPERALVEALMRRFRGTAAQLRPTTTLWQLATRQLVMRLHSGWIVTDTGRALVAQERAA